MNKTRTGKEGCQDCQKVTHISSGNSFCCATAARTAIPAIVREKTCYWMKTGLNTEGYKINKEKTFVAQSCKCRNEEKTGKTRGE